MPPLVALPKAGFNRVKFLPARHREPLRQGNYLFLSSIKYPVSGILPIVASMIVFKMLSLLAPACPGYVFFYQIPPGYLIKKSSSGLKAFCSRRRSFWGRLLKQGVANDHTVQCTGWIVFLRPKRRKAKAHQCFNRCTCNRVRSTRFVWQEIKRTRPRLRSGLRQLLIFCAKFCNLFVGHNTRSHLKNLD
jgi:hypothetical protein